MPGSLNTFRFAHFKVYVKVRQDFVQSKDKKCSQSKPYQGRHHFLKSFPRTHFYTWSQQTPETGRYHYTTGKAKHPIKKSTVHSLE